MFRILKNVVRVNSTEKEILLGVEFTFTLCAFFNIPKTRVLIPFLCRSSPQENCFYFCIVFLKVFVIIFHALGTNCTSGCSTAW